jgi:hypothetical protein
MFPQESAIVISCIKICIFNGLGYSNNRLTTACSVPLITAFLAFQQPFAMART